MIQWHDLTLKTATAEAILKTVKEFGAPTELEEKLNLSDLLSHVERKVLFDMLEMDESKGLFILGAAWSTEQVCYFWAESKKYNERIHYLEKREKSLCELGENREKQIDKLESKLTTALTGNTAKELQIKDLEDQIKDLKAKLYDFMVA